MPASPTLDLTSIESRVFGDYAVALGRCSVHATPPGGTATTSAGHYLTLFQRMDGTWKIMRVVTNFDAPPPADFVWSEVQPADAAANEGTMTALTDAWAQHFNLGHASVVAGHYTDDPKVAFSNGPLRNGKAEVEATLTELAATGSPQITIHDVYTLDLGNGYALDGGRYEVTTSGEQASQRSGTYMSLVQQQPDRSYKPQWHVSNTWPAA
jgi:ketosteroid isomerase-like protein